MILGGVGPGNGKKPEDKETQTAVPPQLDPLGVKPTRPGKLARLKKALLWTVIGVVSVSAGAFASVMAWYNTQLAPVSSETRDSVSVEVVLGATPKQIGDLLEAKEVIRSSTAFNVYTYLSSSRSSLQAGTYSLSPNLSTPDIVKQLVSGDVEQLSVTFLPGATLSENRQVLVDLGVFSEQDIDQALAADYESPLFANKPEGSDLEGYIYGETYKFNLGVSVGEILQTTFDEFYANIDQNGLIEDFKKQGLNLNQAITLASIIQREVVSPADQKQVAQVFLTRISLGMNLGSDVTYQYIADKLGVERDVNLDNPYNTRRYAGLPPGPISAPGLSALEAVANPAGGDYLYFLSGDDDKTYFATTEAEHQSNITNHCSKKCSEI